jgi:hypothetical protein
MVKVPGFNKKKTRNKFKGNGRNKHIADRLIKAIESKQKQLQRKENLEKGRLAKTISFLEASYYIVGDLK